MSSALVRQSLALVDPDFEKTQGKQKPKKVKQVSDLIPENQKLLRRISNKRRKAQKIDLLQKKPKLTIEKARKTIKPKAEIIKENLRKLKQIKEICTIRLDRNLTKQIIERAVTRRPIKNKPASKKSQSTAFTEEDFKKFEEEYFNDDDL